ncbi:MAG: hypothetical protein ACK46Q_04960 [Hyphomonas sp.]
MTEQRNNADWADADAFWDLVQKLDPQVARTIISTIIVSTPQTLQQARNVLKDGGQLKKR